MVLRKPSSIAQDKFKSKKWDEITKGRNFAQSDIPTLVLLVQWHAVIQRCIDDIDEVSGQVAYQNDMGDLKALPQIATMKQASAEVRALNKQLGICDEVKPESKESILNVIQLNRAKRQSGAADKARTA